jgi:predicted ester cyclase
MLFKLIEVDSILSEGTAMTPAEKAADAIFEIFTSGDYEGLQIRYELHDTAAAGDKLAIRATVHGVHNSDHLGVPATGKPYSMHTMHLYRAEGDRLAEHWGVRDEYGVLVQTGVLPPPALPAGLAPTGG